MYIKTHMKSYSGVVFALWWQKDKTGLEFIPWDELS